MQKTSLFIDFDELGSFEVHEMNESDKVLYFINFNH